MRLHLVNFDRTEYDDIEPKSSEKAHSAGKEEDTKGDNTHVAKVEEVGNGEIRFKLGEVER